MNELRSSVEKDGFLSKKQQQIAEENYLTRLLVLAGPGTGKTHTLIHRIRYLIDHEGLVPYQDLLVLSFSRAAVAEIKSRAMALAENENIDSIRFINIWTFDSFATRLLMAAGMDQDISELDYDARVALAVKQLQIENSDASYLLSSIKHVIVDEIQDLVGVRARLVQQVLLQLSGGFTLAGDPAQGIFDYLIHQKSEGPSSVEFLSWIKEKWKVSLQEASLDENYRSSPGIAKIEASIRPVALSTTETGSDSYGFFRNLISELESAGSINEPLQDILLPNGKKVVVLCRTNAEALFTGYALNKKDLPAVIPVSAEEKGLPAWIGRVLSKCTAPRITKTVFEKFWEDAIGTNYEMNPNNGWEFLKEIEAREQDDLDLNILRSRLRHGVNLSFDSEIHRTQNSILVTTVHQAKGREYDRVIIVPPDLKGKLSDADAKEEARILYVAATRAKEKLARLDRTGFPVFVYLSQPSGRKRYLAANRLNRHYFEAGVPGDILEESFVNNTLFQNQSQIDRIQDLLWRNIGPGVQLQLVHQKIGVQDRFIVSMMNPISNNPIPLALMDENFTHDLENYLRSFSNRPIVNFKKRTDGIVVVERRTVVLPPYPQNVPDPYATSGFCVGLSVKGIILVD